jgi:hypothetical protein
MYGSAFNPEDTVLDEDNLDPDAVDDEFTEMTPPGVGSEPTAAAATAALKAGKELRDKISFGLWAQFSSRH